LIGGFIILVDFVDSHVRVLASVP